MADKLKVTLVKSPIGAVPNNAATLGMVKQVSYMVKVEEV